MTKLTKPISRETLGQYRSTLRQDHHRNAICRLRFFVGLPIKECRIHAVGHRRDADAEKNIREGLPLVPLRLVDGCDPVKSRAAGGGPRPLPHAAHR
jgi:hypothetical protein